VTVPVSWRPGYCVVDALSRWSERLAHDSLALFRVLFVLKKFSHIDLMYMQIGRLCHKKLQKKYLLVTAVAFMPKLCSNFILMSFKKYGRIYQRFQIRSLIQNPSIPSQDIPHFLAQLLQNHHFQEKLKNFKHCQFLTENTYSILPNSAIWPN
jgi:hypothetical protein